MRRLILACTFCMQIAHAFNGELIRTNALEIAGSPSLDETFCRNGLFPREQEVVRLAVIEGQEKEKVHFFDDFDGCPSNTTKCTRASYLVRGDEVLVSKVTADWACVWYQGRKHESVGWIPRKNVAPLSASPIHPAREWAGVWIDGPNKIEISLPKADNQAQILSSLRWDGGTDLNGEAIANFGGMSGTLDIQASKARAVEGYCEIRLTRIGKYLIADDNGACGGMNVRHTGVYFRTAK